MQKIPQMDESTTMSIHVTLLESGGEGQIVQEALFRASNLLRGISSPGLRMGSLSLVN